MRITKQTQIALGGDRDVQVYDLLQNETRALPYRFEKTINNVKSPIDITTYTFQFRFVERIADYVSYTKNGIDISGLTAKPGAVEVNLDTQVTVVDAVNGLIQVNIPTQLTSVEPSDPDSVNPVIYSGFLTINDNASNGPTAQKMQYLILVSNDGV